MDYQVAFYQDSWDLDNEEGTDDVVDKVLSTRDAVVEQLRLPSGQEGKVDHVSYGLWLKARTDRPRGAETTTAFVSVKDKGLHRPIPFSYIRTPITSTQIRLLELHPGWVDEPLRARLLVARLDKAPAYTALSYIWGPIADAEHTILLGDHSFKRERITANLHDLLCEVRSRKERHLLWVDALCIDQANIREKSEQVQMMGTIFASAAEVLIWLGTPTQDSRLGAETLQHLASGKALEKNPPWSTHPPELLQKGLHEILDRPWFHRIWTVQEAALSSQKTVMSYAGGITVEWLATFSSVSLFIRGLKFAAVTANWSENGFAGAADLGLPAVDLTGIIDLLGQQLQQIRRRQGLSVVAFEPDLLDIAYEVRDKQCHDPRDRLYAILGLAYIRGAQVQLRPDYSKSLHEVQEEFRLILLKSARSHPGSDRVQSQDQDASAQQRQRTSKPMSNDSGASLQQETSRLDRFRESWKPTFKPGK